MTLVPPQPDYQFIQSSTPSNAKKSDWWLDTSTDPPKSKVYDGSAFVRPEEVEFVDSRVSDAGATQSDIQSAILSDGTTFDGANIDAPISSAGKGVDWTKKTYEISNAETQDHFSNTYINISGSGYIIGIYKTGSSNTVFSVEVDGGTKEKYIVGEMSFLSFFPRRFESSVKISANDPSDDSVHASVVID